MKVNGSAAVIIERIENLKEIVKNEFNENRQDHQDLFDKLGKNTSKITSNSAFIKVGFGVIGIITGILIKYIIG